MRLASCFCVLALLFGCAPGANEDALPVDPPADDASTEPPPLDTEVILDDSTPPRAGCELLVHHAFSECRNGTWHVVTRSTYQCGETQTVKETHVTRTNQPCLAGETAPDPTTLLSWPIGVPDGCQAPVLQTTFYVLACPSAVWNWLAWQRWQCADGRQYLERNGGADKATTVLCDQPPPAMP